METPGYISLSRQMVLRQQMDLISNNLANVTTAGYKSESMLFVEYLQETGDGKTLSFVQDLAIARDLSQGPITLTGNDLDLAIRSEGYFAVETPASLRFTRAGNFTLDEDGRIVTFDGFPLLDPGNGPINVPPDSERITVAPDGTISDEESEIGRIGIFTFENDQLLKKTEGGLYDAGENDPELLREPNIAQGMIEGSNTQAVVEMAKLIDTLRSYQATAKMIDEEHRRQRQAIDTLIAA